jgi:adenosylcobinamide-phosphate synthase
MKYHMLAFFLGFLLDLLLGDPYCLPHPIRLIGKLISKTEQHLLAKGKGRNEVRELKAGKRMVFIVLCCTFLAASAILFLAYGLHVCLGMAVEAVMTYYILAAKCLKVESMKVYRCLKEQGLEKARAAVSMIVGRDTACLDEEGVAKAAVETVAENTSDGVIAPMLYAAVGGPILGFLYKAVNTMDSMIGYKNDKYMYFGRAAAKLDDLVNFLPARISACLMIAASYLGGKDFSGKEAKRIYKRDRRNHASPNSAQTESVCAGALGIRLAGDASYFGRIVKKPTIGDALRKVEYEDIKRANRLMYLTAWLSEAMCLFVMAAVYILLSVRS